MQQLHNEFIASPDDGGLFGDRHAITNDLIISDTMLRLAPPQLRPMTDNHKMIFGCAICNTSKYMLESLNAWRQKQLKIMKDKVDNSRGKGKYELTQSYKLYADYAFPGNKLVIHVAKMQQILFFVHQLIMNVNYPIGNVFFGSVLSVVLFLSQKLKWIHQSEHQ